MQETESIDEYILQHIDPESYSVPVWLPGICKGGC